MVYCTKCGHKNEDSATYCVSCGGDLAVKRGSRSREHEEMCFGLRGRGIWGIVFGAIILIFGVTLLLQQVYGVQIEFWTAIVILIGILIIAGAVSRRRS